MVVSPLARTQRPKNTDMQTWLLACVGRQKIPASYGSVAIWRGVPQTHRWTENQQHARYHGRRWWLIRAYTELDATALAVKLAAGEQQPAYVLNCGKNGRE